VFMARIVFSFILPVKGSLKSFWIDFMASMVLDSITFSAMAFLSTFSESFVRALCKLPMWDLSVSLKFTLSLIEGIFCFFL